MAGTLAVAAHTIALRRLGRFGHVILFANPRATRPKNRRFPLSVMAVGAALPPDVTWTIVDGNIPGIDVFAELCSRIDGSAGGHDPVRTVAFTVMPGPQ